MVYIHIEHIEEFWWYTFFGLLRRKKRAWRGNVTSILLIFNPKGEPDKFRVFLQNGTSEFYPVTQVAGWRTK